MMARSESSVAARICSEVAAGVLAAMVLESLASTAGQSPSMALIQSGRGSGGRRGVQEGSWAARFTSSERSRSVEKKACQEGSTDLGASTHRA